MERDTSQAMNTASRFYCFRVTVGVTSYPGGMPAISRWLSVATPPVSLKFPHPGGMPDTRARHRETSGIPPGCEAHLDCISGGVATLNHRLMAVTPPGSDVGRQLFPLGPKLRLGRS